MPCDLPDNQKKRYWSRHVEVADQDWFSIGFENKGVAAAEWFQKWQSAQPNPDWDFLNDGLLWEYLPGNPLGASGAWSTTFQIPGFVDLFKGTMWFFGFATDQGPPGDPWSLEIRQEFWTQVGPIQGRFYQAARFRLAPSTIQEFTMPALVRSQGTQWPGGDPFGQSQLTPLDRCHDCTSGP